MTNSRCILFVIARKRGPHTDGRSCILASSELSLRQLGYKIIKFHVRPLVLARKSIKPAAQDIMHLIKNFFLKTIIKGWSFNEILFYRSSCRKRIASICKTEKPSFIYIDTIRAFPLIPKDYPSILDFDNLLSLRYSNFASKVRRCPFTPYFGLRLGLLGRICLYIFLRIESGLLRQREIKAGSSVSLPCTVGTYDSLILQKNLGRKVFNIGFIAKLNRKNAKTGHPFRTFFLGNMDYYPNVLAVRHFVDYILPLILRREQDFCLHVVGKIDKSTQLFLNHRNLLFEGYVKRLDLYLKRTSLLIAPINDGFGLKTKVVTCMSFGIPVLGYELAFDGLPANNNGDCLVASSPRDFADLYFKVKEDSVLFDNISRNSLSLVSRHFSLGAQMDAWESHLQTLISRP
jgi:glycosyltransferase involved in cell wall biosynthesis